MEAPRFARPHLHRLGAPSPHSRVQQYNLTVQRQVGGLFGFEAGYVGSYGDHLPIFIEGQPYLLPRRYFDARFPAYSLARLRC